MNKKDTVLLENLIFLEKMDGKLNHPPMTKKNPVMTDKLREILSDPQYKDPKQFTSTIYREDGSYIPEPDEEKMTEAMYFAQFVEPEVAESLVSKLKKMEALEDKGTIDPLTKRFDRDKLANTGGNSVLRPRLEQGNSEWVHHYNWKTQPKKVD